MRNDSRSPGSKSKVRNPKWIAVLILVLPAMAQAQASQPGGRPLWIAVTAPGLAKAVEPLARRRAGEGFEIKILDDTKLRTATQRSGRDIEPICAKLRALLSSRERKLADTLAYVVLVGFDNGSSRVDPSAEQFVLRGGKGSADNMVGLPSDAVIGDLDGDGRPDVSIGRLPARDTAELAGMIDKIVRFESQQVSPAEWQHSFVLLGGSPEYGPVLDALIESLVGAGLDRLDGRWAGRVFYDNANSAFSLPPADLRRAALKAIGDGTAVTVYMGHSAPGGFFLRRDDLCRLKIKAGAGPLIALSCSGAVVGGREGDGFAIESARSPDGPVATFAAAGVSYPHWNKLLAEGLEAGFFNRAPASRESSRTLSQEELRLGEVIAAMRDLLATGKLDLVTLAALNFADGSDRDYDSQRRGHLEMYSLLGDPATRLPSAGRMTITGPRSIQAGGKFRLVGRIDDPRLAAATVLVEARRNWSALPRSTAAETKAERFANANRLELASGRTRAVDGRFEIELAVPPGSAGRQVIVRAWATVPACQAIGSCRIELQAQRPEAGGKTN